MRKHEQIISQNTLLKRQFLQLLSIRLTGFQGTVVNRALTF